MIRCSCIFSILSVKCLDVSFQISHQGNPFVSLTFQKYRFSISRQVQIVGMGADLMIFEVAEANEIRLFPIDLHEWARRSAWADTTYPASSLSGQLFACTINLK